MADPTKLDVSTPAPTRLDNASAAPTLLDSGAAPSPHIHVQLPPALAARFRIERQFPAHGAEADVLLVWPLTGAGRLVLKLYRPGIRPKTEVLERIARAAPEHVVQLFEHGQADGVWYEVLEYAPHGSLRDLMHGSVAPEKALAVLDELSAALGYLHTQQIIHRDLKPENVLIRRLQPLDLALSDFGIASVSEFSQHHTNLSRTVRYSAPEALSGVLSAKTDWWSLGLVLLEMLGGKHPFEGLSDVVIMHSLITLPIDVTAVADPAWNTLCRGLLLRNPQQRWGLPEIQRWRRGENVAVASEHAPTATPETTAQRPYKIGGESCFSAEQLGRTLAQHWTEAVKHLERGLTLGWVRDELKDQALASFIMDLTAENLPADEKLLKLIQQFAPGLPPIYRGIAISGEDLFKLAQQAVQSDNAAEELFWNIYERDILGYFPQNMPLQQLREAWRQGVEDYQSGWETIIQAGAPSKYRPELRVALPSLFLALFSNQNADRLRQQIQIDDIIRRHAHWYLALGEPEIIARAHLPILVTLAPQIITAKKQFEHFYRLLEKTPKNDPIHALLRSLLPLAEQNEGECLRQELQRPRVLPVFDTDSLTEIRTLKKHQGAVLSVAFSPDGSLFASGSMDHSIIFWDVESWQETKVLREYKAGYPCRIVFSPDGLLMASEHSDYIIRLWDVQSGQKIRELSSGVNNSIMSIAFSPDNRLLASGGGDYSVRLWEVETGREVRMLSEHINWKDSIVFSPHSHLLAWIDVDHNVRLTDYQSGKQVRTLHNFASSLIAFSPNGHLLAGHKGSEWMPASGGRKSGWDNTIYLWNVESGEKEHVWTGHNHSPYSLAFSPDSRLLAFSEQNSLPSSGAWDRTTVRLWDIKSRREIQAWTVDNGAYRGIAFSPQGHLLAAGVTDHTVRIWGTNNSLENYLNKVYLDK